MTRDRILYRGGPIFDGQRLLADHRLVLEDGAVVALGPDTGAAPGGDTVDLAGDILCPGFVDLQVNGGDGIMLNDDASAGTLARIAGAHRRLGTDVILPTLITDRPDKVRATIAAVAEAVAAGVPGIAGLHLEGPHLSVARKGAHDPALIHPMREADLAELVAAARALPRLKVTVAPENVTAAQVRTLGDAGIVVSLGHSDADFATCMAYAEAGASCVTHLFNAMSQLGNREPGLVGAALASGALSAGLIADGIHVHPAAMRAAWAAKCGPGSIFLVSDAMACAGSDIRSFELGGRRIERRDGRLTLQDGTLAGADLDLPTAVRVLVREVGVPLAAALAAATSVPARVARLGKGHGRFVTGQPAYPIRLSPELELRA